MTDLEINLRNGLDRLMSASEIAIPRDEVREIELEIELIVDDPESFPPDNLAAYLGVTL
jgi:hypothetical protein